MSEYLATLLVGAAAIYLAAGVLFAIPFVTRWSGRLDHAARNGSFGFRVLIFPASALLWPWLARRLLRSRAGTAG